jgi:hypothetical protein
MKKIIATGMFIGIMSLILIGCGSSTKTIKQKILNERTDVFAEIKDTGSPARGFAVLTIKATIKTHLAEYYALESNDSIHGKSGYPFLINIDGQSAVWTVVGQKESVPLYDKNGKTSHDPEAGEGIKYVLKKKIALRAGTHRVFLGMSPDDYFQEAEITLKEEKEARLEYKPVYNYKSYPHRIPTFLKGLKEYEVYLDGTRIY